MSHEQCEGSQRAIVKLSGEVFNKISAEMFLWLAIYEIISWHNLMRKKKVRKKKLQLNTRDPIE